MAICAYAEHSSGPGRASLQQLDGADQGVAGAAGLALVPQRRRQPVQRLALSHHLALGGEAGDRLLVGAGRLGHPARLERRPGDPASTWAAPRRARRVQLQRLPVVAPRPWPHPARSSSHRPGPAHRGPTPPAEPGRAPGAARAWTSARVAWWARSSARSGTGGPDRPGAPATRRPRGASRPAPPGGAGRTPRADQGVPEQYSSLILQRRPGAGRTAPSPELVQPLVDRLLSGPPWRPARPTRRPCRPRRRPAAAPCARREGVQAGRDEGLHGLGDRDVGARRCGRSSRSAARGRRAAGRTPRRTAGCRPPARSAATASRPAAARSSRAAISRPSRRRSAGAARRWWRSRCPAAPAGRRSNSSGRAAHDHQQRHAVRPVDQVLEEVEQRVVGPVQVLEHQHRGPFGGEASRNRRQAVNAPPAGSALASGSSTDQRGEPRRSQSRSASSATARRPRPASRRPPPRVVGLQDAGLRPSRSRRAPRS